MRGVTLIALLAFFAQTHAEEVASNDMSDSQYPLDNLVDNLVDKLSDETEETEETDEGGETEEADAEDSDAEDSTDDFADELVDKLTDKLVEHALILGVPLQDSPDELEDDDAVADDDDQEESMLDQVLGLSGGAKAMKAMKAMAAMKAMKKAKKKSKVAKGKMAHAMVFRGSKVKTTGGLTKSDLVKNKRGRIVSKKQQATGKALYPKYAAKWVSAVQKARKALSLKGFVAIKKGSPLYTKAKSFYR